MPKYYPLRYLFRRYEILRSIKPSVSFLEVGAGNFELSKEFLHFFSFGKAIDFSPETLTLYNELDSATTQRLSFELENIADLPDGGSYDCVVSCEVMEHLQNDKKFLLKLYGQLKPQGQLIVSVPAHMKFWTVHDEITGHFRRYERQEIIELFEQVGFKGIEVIAYGYPFINMLRWLRVLYAVRQAKVKSHWDRTKQTQHSGVNHISSKLYWLGIFINPLTISPLNWIARFFNNFDLSEGYIVIAEKPK